MTPELLQTAPAMYVQEDVASLQRKVNLTCVVGSLRDGGAERQVLELIRHLDRTRFEPSLVAMEEPYLKRAKELVERCSAMGIPEADNSRRFGRSLSLATAVGRTSRFFRDIQSDIVHGFLPGPCILGTAAARLAGVPLIIGSRRSLASQYRSGSHIAGWADTAAFHLAHFNLGNSQAVSREMVDIGGCPEKKCGTIHNGVDLRRFRPSLTPVLRHELRWSQDEVVFGIVANFRHVKRHGDFAKAAALIAQRHPSARFVMAGADGGAKTSVLQQVRELDLGAKMQVLDSNPCPEEIFAALDVYICTSEAEGFSTCC